MTTAMAAIPMSGQRQCSREAQSAIVAAIIALFRFRNAAVDGIDVPDKVAFSGERLAAVVAEDVKLGPSLA